MLYVVCGYPASGMSTWCRQQVRNVPGAIVFDMDSMRQALTAADDHDARMSRSIGEMLNDVAHWMEREYCGYGLQDMFLIRMAPTSKEMDAYQLRDDVTIIMIDTPKEICLQRAQARKDFDLAAFGKACGKVDRFRSIYAREILTVSPPIPPPE